jgi:hypothetical protein
MQRGGVWLRVDALCTTPTTDAASENRLGIENTEPKVYNITERDLLLRSSSS